MPINCEHMVFKSSVRKTDLFGSLVNQLIFTLEAQVVKNLPAMQDTWV